MKTTYIIGFYPVKMAEYAHLLEHLFVVEKIFNQFNGKYFKEETGGRYISIIFKTIEVIDKEKIIQIFENIDFSDKAIMRERDIVISELQERLTKREYECFYRLLEFNITSEKKYTTLMEELNNMTVKELKLILKQTVQNTKWFIFTNHSKDFKSNLKEIPNIQKKHPIVIEHNNPVISSVNNAMRFALVFDCKDKNDEILTMLFGKVLDNNISKKLRNLAVHNYSYDHFNTWGNRVILHFCFWPARKQIENIKSVFSKMVGTLKTDHEIIDEYSKSIKKYISTRNKIDLVFEVADYGKIIEKSDNIRINRIDNLKQFIVY